MLNLHVIQARFGDCLLLEYGAGAERHFMLIDGGPPNTFDDDLKDVLTSVVGEGGHLGRVVLSHVDNDHIVGLVDLFSELRRQKADGETELVLVGGLWHNSFSKAIDPNGAIAPRMMALAGIAGVASTMNHAGAAINGISEGNKLRQLALLLQIPINSGMAELITVDSVPTPQMIDGLKVTIVGPTQENLDQLRLAWEAWLDEHEDEIATGDPQTLANLDKTVPNLSSISFVTEIDSKTILFTGDARSDHVYAGLRAQGLLDADGSVHFDVLKLPHHGSERNIDQAFFAKVTADRYVISANGRDGNPDLKTLLWLVDAAQADGRHPEIIVTNRTDSSKKLVTQRKPSAHGYKLTVLKAGKHSISLAFA